MSPSPTPHNAAGSLPMRTSGTGRTPPHQLVLARQKELRQQAEARAEAEAHHSLERLGREINEIYGELSGSPRL